MVLGYDYSDEPQFALQLLKENAATFPSVVDCSDVAASAGRGYRITAVPTTYLIDREGRIVAGWIGYSEENDPTLEHLKKLGIE